MPISIGMGLGDGVLNSVIVCIEDLWRTSLKGVYNGDCLAVVAASLSVAPV